MKILHYIIIIILFSVGAGIAFAQSDYAQIQNGASLTNSTCTDDMIQDMKIKYASFDEERAKTEAVNYDAFKSEVKNDTYIFRAVSQEWTDDQVKCTVTFKNALVLFIVTDSSGKDRDVTVLINPVSYKPQSIDVKYDVPTHGGVVTTLSPLKQALGTQSFCNQQLDHGPTLGETIGMNQCENPATLINYQGVNLTVINMVNKTEFGIGENITIVPELVNHGNHNVTVSYCGQLFVTLVTDKYNRIVSPQYSWACPLFDSHITLEPSIPAIGEGYGHVIALYNAGNYTVRSIASFSDPPNQVILWSKPVQIAIMPENYTQKTNHTISQNVMTVQDGDQVTPLQTHDDNGNNLTIHYEKGTDVTGKVMPTGPPPQLDNSSSIPEIAIGGIIGVAVVGIFIFIRSKNK